MDLDDFIIAVVRVVDEAVPHLTDGQRLRLEQLPGYVPDLDPDEGTWNYLKRVELANQCCRDLSPSWLWRYAALRRTKERPRHKRTLIQAGVRQAGYHVELFVQPSVIACHALCLPGIRMPSGSPQDTGVIARSFSPHIKAPPPVQARELLLISA